LSFTENFILKKQHRKRGEKMGRMNIKKLLFVFICVSSVVVLRAQVTIGMDEAPANGAMLQLKSLEVTDDSPNSEKGLGLPRVALSSSTDLFPMFKSNGSGGYQNAVKTDDDKKHKGLMVYNTGTAAVPVPGIYVWDGTKWSSTAAGTWNKVGTTAPAQMITDNIYQQGAVAIGKTAPDRDSYMLDVARTSRMDTLIVKDSIAVDGAFYLKNSPLRVGAAKDAGRTDGMYLLRSQGESSAPKWDLVSIPDVPDGAFFLTGTQVVTEIYDPVNNNTAGCFIPYNQAVEGLERYEAGDSIKYILSANRPVDTSTGTGRTDWTPIGVPIYLNMENDYPDSPVPGKVYNRVSFTYQTVLQHGSRSADGQNSAGTNYAIGIFVDDVLVACRLGSMTGTWGSAGFFATFTLLCTVENLDKSKLHKVQLGVKRRWINYPNNQTLAVGRTVPNTTNLSEFATSSTLKAEIYKLKQ